MRPSTDKLAMNDTPFRPIVPYQSSDTSLYSSIGTISKHPSSASLLRQKNFAPILRPEIDPISPSYHKHPFSSDSSLRHLLELAPPPKVVKQGKPEAIWNIGTDEDPDRRVHVARTSSSTESSDPSTADLAISAVSTSSASSDSASDGPGRIDLVFSNPL